MLTTSRFRSRLLVLAQSQSVAERTVISHDSRVTEAGGLEPTVTTVIMDCRELAKITLHSANVVSEMYGLYPTVDNMVHYLAWLEAELTIRDRLIVQTKLTDEEIESIIRTAAARIGVQTSKYARRLAAEALQIAFSLKRVG